MLSEKRLKLSKGAMLTHYAIVLFLLLMPTLTLVSLFEIYVTNTYNGVRSSNELIVTGFPWLIPALVFYYLQRRKLNFKEVVIPYTDNEFKEAVCRTVNELKWEVELNNRNILRAYRHSSFTLSWGEMITIIKQPNRLLVNCICDPTKMSSIASFGWNKRNIGTLLRNLHEVQEQIPEKLHFPDKLINEWSFTRTIGRLLIYPFCLFLIALGVYLVLSPQTLKTQIAGIGAMVAGTFYLYLDLKIIASKKSKR